MENYFLCKFHVLLHTEASLLNNSSLINFISVLYRFFLLEFL